MITTGRQIDSLSFGRDIVLLVGSRAGKNKTDATEGYRSRRRKEFGWIAVARTIKTAIGRIVTGSDPVIIEETRKIDLESASGFGRESSWRRDAQ